MDKASISQLMVNLPVYLTFPILYIIRYHFYKNLLGFKKSTKIYIILSIFLFIYSWFDTKLDSIILRYIFNYIILFFNVSLLCKGNFIIKLYTVAVENAILALFSLACFPIDIWTIQYINDMNLSFIHNLIVSFIYSAASSILSYIVLYVILIKISSFLNIKDKQISLFQSLYLFIPCISISGFATIFYIIQQVTIDDKTYYLPNIDPKMYYIISSFVCILFLLAIPIMAYTFKKMIESEEEMQKNIIVKKQFEAYTNHIKNVDNIYLDIRKVIHDMNNHIACLKSLADNNNTKEIREYLYNLSETVSKLDFKIKTGNPICDAIVNEKFNISQSEGMEFECEFLVPKNTSIDSIDLCVILGNALDNSIEACRKIINPLIKKKIILKSYIRGLYLIIEVCNTTEEGLIIGENNKIISSKTDRINHGLGLSNIKDVVKKYNGVIDIIEEKNLFTISIMFKIG